MNRVEQLGEQSFKKEEWQKLFFKYQQEYIRRRLEAIKYLHEGKTRKEVIEKIGCARQSLISWIDIYCKGGLEALTKPTKSNRIQRLDDEKKAEIKKMLASKFVMKLHLSWFIWRCEISRRSGRC